jgi:glycosyltransferase EpsH
MKVSIIVPAHNALPDLLQCIESLIAQTHTDLEIILVDDGSTDNSGATCDDYATRDRRVTVIHQPNRGVSSARNAGLKRATGQAVMFVDSDDWIDIDSCATAVEVLGQPEVDVVMFPYVREFAATSMPRHVFPGNREWTGTEALEILQRRVVGLLGTELRDLEAGDSLGVVWGKLYRMSLISGHGLEFIDLAEIASGEDGLFNLDFLRWARKAVYLDRCLYHYRRTSNETITRRYRPDLERQWRRAFDRWAAFTVDRRRGPDFREALDNRIALSLIGLGLNEAHRDNPKPLRQRISSLRGYLKSDTYAGPLRHLRIRSLGVKWRPFFLLCRYRLAALAYLQLVIIRQLMRRRAAG